MGIIGSIILGALTGWVAGKIMDTKGGFLRNLIVGLIGGSIGGWIGNVLNISGGKFIGFGLSVVGSCLLIWVCKKIFK